MQKAKAPTPRIAGRRGPTTEMGKLKSSQNARKFEFTSERELTEQEKKSLEELYYELFETEDDNFPYHDGMLLFMSVKKAARVRKEIEGVMEKLRDSARQGKFERLDPCLHDLERLRRYERRSRSEVATRVMKGKKKNLSKLSNMRRSIANKMAG